MTTPASTFRRACGDVKFSVSSLNLSTTRRDTASARTCGGDKVLAYSWIGIGDRQLGKSGVTHTHHLNRMRWAMPIKIVAL